jgi:hypothetical protein
MIKRNIKQKNAYIICLFIHKKIHQFQYVDVGNHGRKCGTQIRNNLCLKMGC